MPFFRFLPRRKQSEPGKIVKNRRRSSASSTRLCRLEPLEDRRLLSVTHFQPPEPAIYGPSPRPALATPLAPLVEKTILIDYEDSTTTTGNAVTSGDGITNYYAVVVGIADYPGSVNDLDYPTNDAQSLRDMLLTGTNWRPENVSLLTDSEATTSAIVASIRQMGTATDADDVCLFYYAGHGVQEPDQAPFDESDSLDEVLATYDYTGIGTGISDDLLISTINSLPTDNFLLILDCCQSSGLDAATATFDDSTIAGGIAEDLLVSAATATASPPMTTRAYHPGQGIAITACAEGELSAEAEPVEHGVFTYNLLEGLKGWADRNDDGWVSAEECFDFAEYNARIQNPEAHPTIFDAHLGELPLVQLASAMPEVLYHENFSGGKGDWITADQDGDGYTWSWYEDETMAAVLYYPTTTVSTMDGLGSMIVDCTGYENVFFRMDHNVTSYVSTLDMDLDLIDTATQRTTVWSEKIVDHYDLGSVALDISDLAGNESAVSMEWWFIAEIPPGQSASWELIDVEFRASNTKDIRVSVLDRGFESGNPVRARVDILAALPYDLTVSLDSADASEVTTPATVTIPAGATTAEFSLSILDDTSYDGTQTVTITASANGYQPGNDTIDILDNEPARLVGDANLDGRVDGSDVTILANHWQSTSADWSMGDFNGDGRVDGSDVTILANHWQATSGVASTVGQDLS